MSRKIKLSKAFFWGFAALLTLLFVLFLACMGTSLKVKAGTENKKNEKTVSAVFVKEGDTIWSIASDFYTEDYENINELVEEIQSCNGVSEHIRIGQKLFIPHYKQL